MRTSSLNTTDHRRRDAFTAAATYRHRYGPIGLVTVVLFLFLYLDTRHDMSFAVLGAERWTSHNNNTTAQEEEEGSMVFNDKPQDRRKAQAMSSSSLPPTTNIALWKRMLVYLTIPSFLAAFRTRPYHRREVAVGDDGRPFTVDDRLDLSSGAV